ncbi:uncharacterized protein LOC9634509 [Selaginella moellendorffii]|uniref:uncharacterized protein LOC9634509 n=1 Tax=Selaginella moellendorffii TaxID=88036 RepID=UPI000D1CEAAD|nr:uncharacterized protein LOC9634509 [Selaginella moellendorffii]|eukprot:XP_024540219.1 uncharacterized protein LOC9634509 [Selaginella moellendorffii]
MALRQAMRLLVRRCDRSPLLPARSIAAHFATATGGTRSKTKEDAAPLTREERKKKYAKFEEKDLIIPDPNPATEAVQEMYDKMMLQMSKGDTFSKADLFELFHACKTRADINLCLKLLERLHKFRAAQLKVFRNFNADISELVAKAFTQINEPKYALRVFTRYNRFGLTPDIKASHKLLEYASDKFDIGLSFDILRHMRENSQRPNADSAHLFIKQGMKTKRAVVFLDVAREFHLNDVQLHPTTYDICLVCAANAGRAKDVMEIQKYREQYKIPPSPSSTFSLAKALLLKAKPEDAAKLIHEECKDEEVLGKYIKSMVRLWPVKLATCHTGSRKSAKSSMRFVRDMLVKMLGSLSSLGVKVDIDIEQNFGAAKGSGDKYEFCFGEAKAEAA